MLGSIWSMIGGYARPYVEEARLTVSDRLARLLGVCALVLLVGSLLLLATFFVTVGVAVTLEGVMDPIWAYLCVAGFYFLLVAVLIAFRKQLVFRPIAGFAARLLGSKTDEPNDTADTNEGSPKESGHLASAIGDYPRSSEDDAIAAAAAACGYRPSEPQSSNIGAGLVEAVHWVVIGAKVYGIVKNLAGNFRKVKNKS